MHLLTSLLALTSLQLATAADGSARVTQAPEIPKVFRRQDYVCPTGDYTMCADGFGCCERGAPCTTIRGEAACDTGECNGLPCGDAGLCCDATCTSSSGTPICVHGSGSGSTTTDNSNYNHPTISTSFDDWDSSTITFIPHTRPTKIIPGSDITSGEDEDSTTTMWASDETSEFRPTRPTASATSSGSDTMATATVTQTVSPNGEPFPTSSNDDTGVGSGGDSGSGGGAGMVSPRGAFVVLGWCLLVGCFWFDRFDV